MSGGERSMEEVIDFVLRKNRERLTAGYGSLESQDPAEALMRKEEGPEPEEWEIRNEAFRQILEFFFQDGPEPLAVLRRVFATVKAVAPHLVGDMSCEDIALICGDGGRATVSARIKRIYNGKLKESGMKAVKAPFQKSEEAVRTFSEAQKGNKNRARKKGRRRK